MLCQQLYKLLCCSIIEAWPSPQVGVHVNGLVCVCDGGVGGTLRGAVAAWRLWAAAAWLLDVHFF